MRALLVLLLCGSALAGEVMVSQHEDDFMVLTNEKCDPGPGMKFKVKVKDSSTTGCWTLSENGFVVARYDDKTIYVYPIVIFRPVTGV